MKLSDSDLQQLDEAKVLRMQPEHKDKLLVTLISDLKEARERLNANSQNSSRPPRTDPPWSNANDAPANNATPAAKAPESKGTTPKSTETSAPDNGTVIALNEASLKRKVGHQVGEEGHGRHLTLPVSFIHTHNPSHCALCGDALNAAHFRATGGHYVLDIDITAHEGLAGIRVKHEKHLYGEIVCACGHKNHSQPGSCPDDPLWVNLSMNERGLVGPVLASLIVCLAKRMRLSRFRIQEYLHDWLSIDLSTSTINRCIHEAGRAVEPLEEEMVKELKAAALLYADETPWKEWGQLLWLWVIISPSICLYLIGDRSKELLANIFGDQIDAWLMSDGYKVYRKYQKRLRCWAHIIRKAKGLEESFDPEVRMFGNQANQLLERLMQAIYQARESPPTACLTVTYADDLAAFKQRCEEHRDSRHDKTKALARELLNDWESFWIVLKHPHLPLTNNEAERALRHWVIARLITQGTRTSQGTRAFGLLASVIETCRKRNILPWPYLALVIAERRKGNPAPSLPPMALAV